MTAPTIVWLRQDLRLLDQPAFAAAAAEGPVVPLYVLDDETPGAWTIGEAQRWWLHHSLDALGANLAAKGVPLVLRRGMAAEEVARLASEIGAARVHALAHYEPWWQKAEEAVAERLDLVIHDGALLADPRQVRTKQGGRYRIFTPFWRALLDQMPPVPPQPAPKQIEGVVTRVASDRLGDWNLLPTSPGWATGLAEWTPGEAGALERIKALAERIAGYDRDRNLPSLDGSSRLSPHLHFGEVSPAAVWHAATAAEGDATPYLREIGWRDFTANMIDQFPDLGDANGRAAYDRMPWRSGVEAERDFVAWTRGRTGYPIIDAGMRELWATGWMHNRVRMLAASFLVKHLLIDWRRGARWFWDTLVDADYGNNSVNWQWIAGTGVDSNPFGRIMAPLAQSAKYDAADYIRRWVPELAALTDADIHDPHAAGCSPHDYPAPLIGHREARARALEAAGAR
ncbi:MAG: DNA photolyase family protein [Sphingomonas bacterium]|nr:DNA photolyase family protein [Sphingomonas bacterium]